MRLRHLALSLFLILIALHIIKRRDVLIRPYFLWRDLWVGLYIDNAPQRSYYLGLPMIGLKFTEQDHD